MSAPSRRLFNRPEPGIATVWAVAWMSVCLSIGWLGLLAATIASRQHHLDGAADLAALSAAARHERAGDACAVASAVAVGNDVAVQDCSLRGEDVVVTVSDSVSLPFSIAGDLTATSRAGP